MKKIESSAIYYALFLSVIFALVLGGLLLFSGFNQNFSLQMDIEEILIDNSKSGIAYGQVNYKEFKNNEPILIRLFNEGPDSVEIIKKPWGAFTIIQSKAIHRNKSFTKIALLGGASKIEQPNLYIPDNGRPISICGDTRIEGKCYLPKSGLKRAYISGKNYTGSKMVYGTIYESKKHLPEMKKDIIENITTVFGDIEEWQKQDSIIVSFADNAVHYIKDSYINIDNTVIKGQVILEAKDSIFIGKNASIENAIIKSKIVYIESGFSGTVQIFASEKIIIEEKVQLKYPSVLGLIEVDFPQNTSAKITIGENSQVIGTVFLISEKPNFRRMPKLSIQSNAEIDGFVYCAGKTEIKGIINGTLYTDKLYLTTASSAYENHLLDAEILNQLPKGFIAANLMEETSMLQQIAWLK